MFCLKEMIVPGMGARCQAQPEGMGGGGGAGVMRTEMTTLIRFSPGQFAPQYPPTFVMVTTCPEALAGMIVPTLLSLKGQYPRQVHWLGGYTALANGVRQSKRRF